MTTTPKPAASDYELFYWSVPFRGQFVRALLAFAGKSWSEAGDEAIGKLMEGAVADMPVPFMGPPLLIDRKSGVAIAQMPAIILYLGESLDLLPKDAAGRAMTLKVVGDANDVIDELTLDGGRQMWTAERWRDFVPRLEKWMSFWEETGRRHGLTLELRAPAGRRGAGRRGRRHLHAVDDDDRPVRNSWRDARQDRAHDGRAVPPDRRHSRAGEAGR